MMRWGAVVPDADKQGIVEYLAKNFGPGNKGYSPTKVAPVAK
jgi:hypothetical protein